MALTEKLELLLTADPSQGISALRSFSSEAEKSASKTTSSLQRISTTAMKLGAGGIGVGGFLTQMASADIEAANQLDAAIRTAGQTQSDYKDRINDTVGAMANFGHTDEEVSGALTALTIAYGDTNAALDQMQLVADLAARKHTSLADAATTVAKAHGGSARLFKEFGIQVQVNADGTKNYDGALSDLAAKLSGQASAAADSWSGKLRELRANAENLVSEFGQNFGPMILGVSTLMTGLGGITSGAAALMSRFRTTTEQVTTATNSAASVQSLYNQKVGASKVAIGLGVTAAATAVAGLYAYGQSLDDVGAKVEDFAALSDQSWEQQTQTVLELIDVYKGPFANRIDNIIQHYRDLGPAGVEELQRIRDAVANAGGDTSKFDAAIGGAKQSMENLGTATGGTNTKLEDQARKYKDIEDAADKAFTATLKLAPADIRVKQGALNIADAKARQAQAEGDLAAARAEGDPKKIETAERDLANASLNYISAVEDEAVAVADLKETQDAANGITEDARTKTQNYLDALSFLNAGLTGPTHDALATYIWDATVARNKTDELRVATLQAEGLSVPFHDLSRTAANRGAGGTGFPGSTYFIEPGTKGEYFTPTQSGWFTPVDKMGKGGYTVNIGQIVTADPADAGEQVARRLRIEAVLAAP